jgi:hypothetical protein
MKKRIKLSLNSQTIRRLTSPALTEIQGGLAQPRMPVDDSVEYCISINIACGRGCG